MPSDDERKRWAEAFADELHKRDSWGRKIITIEVNEVTVPNPEWSLWLRNQMIEVARILCPEPVAADLLLAALGCERHGHRDTAIVCYQMAWALSSKPFVQGVATGRMAQIQREDTE